VLFSSHQLDVVERLCDDLVIIADGTIRARARDALRADHAQRRYELVSAPISAGCATSPASRCSTSTGATRSSADTDETAQRVLQRAVAAGAVRLHPAASLARPDLQGGHPVTTSAPPSPRPHRPRPVAQSAWLVAEREISSKLRSKAFIISFGDPVHRRARARHLGGVPANRLDDAGRGHRRRAAVRRGIPNLE
jgi:hypothetical protein